MPKLVTECRTKREIGEVFFGCSDPIAEFHPGQAVLVIGESTLEEWIECLVRFGQERAWLELISRRDSYFYEVLTD